MRSFNTIPALLLLCASLAWAGKTALFAPSMNEARRRATVVAGAIGKGTVGGLKLEGDTHVRFDPGHIRAASAEAVLTVIPPDMRNTILPVASGENECFCAFKIHFGRVVMELSERWIKFCRLTPDGGAVDTLFARRDMSMVPDGTPVEIGFAVEDGAAFASVNGQTMLSAPVSGYDFSRPALVTFRKPFEVVELALYRLHKDTLRVDTGKKHIDLAARFHPARFNASGGQNNHHAVAFENGLSAPHALFTTYAPDTLVHDALVRIGARPGNNLTRDTWEQRAIPSASAPGLRVEGTPLRVEIVYARKAYPLATVLREAHGKKSDFRFGGNRSQATIWHSGCVVCLLSCPGGVVGNRRYTVRDRLRGVPDYAVAPDLPFSDGSEVVVRIRAD